MNPQFPNLGTIVEATTGERWHPGKLRTEIAKRAATLKALKVGPESLVLINHGGTPSFFCDLLAVWQRGACALVANPGLSPFEAANLVEFFNPTVIVSADGPVAQHKGRSQLNAHLSAYLDRPALILLTSGTTGQPKGVTHSLRSLLSRVALNRTHIGSSDLATTLCTLPTHFGHGLIGNCLTPLLSGQTLILCQLNSVALAAKLSELIDQYGVTFLSSVPTFWKLATRASRPPTGGSLRRVHIGSAPLSSEHWNEIIDWSQTRNVVNMYGITETANWIAGASANEFTPLDGLIGRMWGGTAAVRNECGQLVETGSGEIVIQSPSIMMSYYCQSDLTAQVIDGSWYRTGDIGTIDAGGVIRLTGRLRDEINRAGIKVHPADIDILLERNVCIREACSFAIPDAVAGQTVAVAVVAESSCELDVSKLKAWCSERLVTEKRPAKWFVLDEIPKNANGKISRATVAEHCLQREVE